MNFEDDDLKQQLEKGFTLVDPSISNTFTLCL